MKHLLLHPCQGSNAVTQSVAVVDTGETRAPHVTTRGWRNRAGCECGEGKLILSPGWVGTLVTRVVEKDPKDAVQQTARRTGDELTYMLEAGHARNTTYSNGCGQH